MRNWHQKVFRSAVQFFMDAGESLNVGPHGVKGRRDAPGLGELRGNFADQLTGQTHGILHHVGVLLDVLLHHLKLRSRLLYGLVIALDERLELFKVGDAIKRLRDVFRAVPAVDRIRMDRSGGSGAADQ